MIAIFNIIAVAFFIYGVPDMLSYFIALKNKGAKITDPIKAMFNCFKCVSFWVALAMTGGNFILACKISVAGYLIDKYIISKY